MAAMPKSIKIAGLRYDVAAVDNLILERGNFGECNVQKQTITLDKGNRTDKQKETLLHEMLEAMNTHYNIDLSHHQLSLVSVAMTAALLDNENLRKYLLS